VYGRTSATRRDCRSTWIEHYELHLADADLVNCIGNGHMVSKEHGMTISNAKKVKEKGWSPRLPSFIVGWG
jgi:hypothetical protein